MLLRRVARIPAFVGSLLEPWSPSVCVGCGRSGPSPCGRCLGRLRPAPMAPSIEGLAGDAALVAYDEWSRPFVTTFKQFGDLRSIDGLLGGLVDLAVDLLGDLDGRPEAGGAVLLTWAPTTRRRRRHRGHDQARLLARAIGERCGLAATGLLDRVDGPSQEGRSALERREGVEFRARDDRRLARGAAVVVVDDVMTTGSTMAAASTTLLGMGAAVVGGLTLARTPGPTSARG